MVLAAGWRITRGCAKGMAMSGSRPHPSPANDSDPAVLPEDCRSMAEVRAEIDRLDRILVSVMAERQAYIEAAARIKPRRSQVRLEWRIEDVVSKVMRQATLAGLSQDIAEPVWRLLIDRCIAHEDVVWGRLHDENPQ
jgi:isochorismate pyruvate lyase